MIRKSTDLGINWSKPKNKSSGLLKKGSFHCAPSPVVEHCGRLYHAMERKESNIHNWPSWYSSFVMSIDKDKNLLDGNSWSYSN